jgi:hypothetical protein
MYHFILIHLINIIGSVENIAENIFKIFHFGTVLKINFHQNGYFFYILLLVQAFFWRKTKKIVLLMNYLVNQNLKIPCH